jgi:integrase
MAIEKRKNREKWGYRYTDASGKRRAVFKWNTKGEAAKAHARFLTTQKSVARGWTMEVLCEKFYAEAQRKNRSKWRLKAIGWNAAKWYIPFYSKFGPVSSITPRGIEDFMDYHRNRGASLSTIWHYIVDLRAMFNFAILEGVLVGNPVTRADLGILRKRQKPKAFFNPELVEQGATTLAGRERVYYDACRFLGLHKDEANRLEWKHFDEQPGWVRVPGTKNEYREALIPVPAALGEQLKALPRDCDYLFHYKGRKQYSRRKMFDRVNKSLGLKGMGRLKPKDLRDYYATEIASKTQDPAVLQALMRHANVTTTSRYLRHVKERMQDAVKGLGQWSSPETQTEMSTETAPGVQG